MDQLVLEQQTVFILKDGGSVGERLAIHSPYTKQKFAIRYRYVQAYARVLFCTHIVLGTSYLLKS